MSVTVRGASDDLIEVEGDISEEFSPVSDDGEETLIGFSDGTVLAISYGLGGGGFWRIRRVAVGSAEYALREATDEREDYSDVATLNGPLKWCVCGSELVRPGRARSEESDNDR